VERSLGHWSRSFGVVTWGRCAEAKERVCAVAAAVVPGGKCGHAELVELGSHSSAGGTSERWGKVSGLCSEAKSRASGDACGTEGTESLPWRDGKRP
jgi:hypothetical protein